MENLKNNLLNKYKKKWLTFKIQNDKLQNNQQPIQFYLFGKHNSKFFTVPLKNKNNKANKVEMDFATNKHSKSKAKNTTRPKTQCLCISFYHDFVFWFVVLCLLVVVVQLRGIHFCSTVVQSCRLSQAAVSITNFGPTFAYRSARFLNSVWLIHLHSLRCIILSSPKVHGPTHTHLW